MSYLILILAFTSFSLSIFSQDHRFSLYYDIGDLRYGPSGLNVNNFPLPSPESQREGFVVLASVDYSEKGFLSVIKEIVQRLPETFIDNPSAQAVSDPVAAVTKLCLEQDFQAKRCQVQRGLDALMYEDSPTNMGYNLVQKLIHSKLNWTKEKKGGTTSKERRQQIINKLKEKSVGLKSCQQACLISCATSVILSYDRFLSSRLKKTTDLYSEGAGACTEFSRIAEDLGTSIGLKVKVASREMDHTFIKYEIEGGWYYAEPQDSECLFYPAFTKDFYEYRASTSKPTGERSLAIDKSSVVIRSQNRDLLLDPLLYQRIEEGINDPSQPGTHIKNK